MKIYRCDKCGLEMQSHSIVGNEFDYSGKFETLTPQWRSNGVVDVCKDCFKALSTAINTERRTQAETLTDKVKRMFYGATP